MAYGIIAIFTGVKRLLFFFVVPLCCAMVSSDNPSCAGNVNSQNGVGIYIYCLPDRPYDTVCTFSTDIGFNSYAGPSIPNKVIGFERPIDALVRKAVKKEKRRPKAKRQDISAIISFDAKQAVAVRFTTQVKEALVTRALVQQYKGYYIFIQSRPVARYQVLEKVSIGSEIDLKFNGYASMTGLLDSLIFQYEKKGISEGKKADALITATGLEAEFIQLNQ